MQLDSRFEVITKDAAVALMESRRQRALAISDFSHRRMVQNWLLHVMLEVGGKYEQIFSRGLVVDEPVYEFFQFQKPLVGKAAVLDFYAGLFSPGAPTSVGDVHRVATADWGFASEQTNYQFLDAERARGLGLPVDDSCSAYLLQRPLCLIWHFEAGTGRLQGERLYFAPPVACRYTPIRADQILTTDDLASAFAPVLARTWDDHAESTRAIEGR